MRNSGMEFPQALQIVITAVGVLVLFTATFVFPVLAKFENTIYRTLKNALIMSILQFPKTIAMLILGIVVPIALYIFVPAATPVVFLFGLSVPAFLSALMYNKFFKKLEAQMEENSGPKENQNPEEDERIFKDELDETLIDREDRK